jgi:crotonobetaine/carnitine-CoA ligase
MRRSLIKYGSAINTTDVHPALVSPLRGLPLPAQTLPALLDRQAAAYGNKPLLRFGDTELGFDAVRDVACAAAAALAAVGIEPGDRVVLLAANRLELVQVVLGCAWMGAVVVPLNVALRGAQLEHALQNSAARLVIAEPELLPLLETVALPDALERVWAIGDAPARAVAGVRAEPAPPIGASGEPIPPGPVGPGTTLAILYTSGTTGPSKGVCCPHAQFYWWGITVGELLELTENDVLYTCLPMFHTNALNAFVQALLAGATFVVGERFSASRFWGRVADAGATVTYLLGAMINILHGQPPGDQERAHAVTRALAPATPVALHKPFEERFGVKLLEAYGSTETNAAIGAALARQRPGYMGVVLPDFEIDVVDDDDATVPDGTAGELVLRPRHPFSFATGYFGMPEATVTAWRNLWFHSGDRVVREPDGWVRFLDRTKDAIRRRGENISSFEVEHAILSHSGVASVAAFAVASELAEDEVMVAVVPESGAQINPIELTRYCEERLAYFAIPRYVDIVSELPVTENGKVRKAVLRERGVTETTWDREAAGYKLRR